MELEEYLKEYKALTLDIMERTNEDGSIAYLVEERQIILDEIARNNFEKNNIELLCNKFKIVELDDELNILVKEQIANTKIKIAKMKKMRTANMQYVSLGYVPSIFNKQM